MKVRASSAPLEAPSGQAVKVDQEPPLTRTGRAFSPSGLWALAGRHHAPFIKFCIIGASVFVLQFFMQMMLIRAWRIDPVFSYIALTIGCIQLNFLLNRRLTWRDRNTPLWAACYRFNAQRIIATAVNFILYAGFVKLGLNYLLANVLLTIFFMVINYAFAHIWAFAAVRAPEPGESPNDA